MIARWALLIFVDVCFVAWLLTYSRAPEFVPVEQYGAEWLGGLSALGMILLHLLVLGWADNKETE